MDNKKVSYISIIITLMVIGLTLYGFIYFKPEYTKTEKINTENTTRIYTENTSNHTLGNINSNIKIVEYSDTECPFCKEFHTTMHTIIDIYGGKISWEYRHFPLDRIHPKARKEAEATECVAEIGGENAFWNYIDKIFEVTPSNNQLAPSLLTTLAVEQGIDKDLFNTCLNSGKFAEKVNNDFKSGIKDEVNGTPYIIIYKNGVEVQSMSGAVPFEKLEKILNAII